jgi:hypothetical protein
MRALDRDLRVYEIARRVGVSNGDSAVESILNFCRQLVASWTRQSGGAGSIQDLEKLVCSRLNLEFQEFRHESELEAIVRRQVEAGDVVFASLPTLFDDETFATLIRCRQRASDGAGGSAAGTKSPIFLPWMSQTRRNRSIGPLLSTRPLNGSWI